MRKDREESAILQHRLGSHPGLLEGHWDLGGRFLALQPPQQSAQDSVPSRLPGGLTPPLGRGMSSAPAVRHWLFSQDPGGRCKTPGAQLTSSSSYSPGIYSAHRSKVKDFSRAFPSPPFPFPSFFRNHKGQRRASGPGLGGSALAVCSHWPWFSAAGTHT